MVFREKRSDGSTVITGLTMKDILAAVRDSFYPIGKIYFTTVNVNPAGTIGGTWVAWGSGRVPVGVDVADGNFNTVEKTGGANTHSHGMASAGAAVYNGGAVYTKTNAVGIGWTSDRNFVATGGNTTAGGTSIGNGGTVAILGNSDAGSSLQKFITCYMWKRTA